MKYIVVAILLLAASSLFGDELYYGNQTENNGGHELNGSYWLDKNGLSSTPAYLTVPAADTYLVVDTFYVRAKENGMGTPTFNGALYYVTIATQTYAKAKTYPFTIDGSSYLWYSYACNSGNGDTLVAGGKYCLAAGDENGVSTLTVSGYNSEVLKNTDGGVGALPASLVGPASSSVYDLDMYVAYRLICYNNCGGEQTIKRKRMPMVIQ